MPCGWHWWGDPQLGAAARSTASAYTGLASLRIYDVSPTQPGNFVVRSDCIEASPGDYAASFWRRGDPAPNEIRLTLAPIDAASCQGNELARSFIRVSSTTGSWQQFTGTLTAPDGTQSARLELGAGCYPIFGCDDFDAFIDDVDVAPGPPTAVRVVSLAAARTGNRIRIRWRTSSEAETLGFNVYRQQPGKLVKLNRALIPSVFGGTTSGHAYSWLDRNAPRGAARYRLQAVSLSGKRSWVGAATVTVAR